MKWTKSRKLNGRRPEFQFLDWLSHPVFQKTYVQYTLETIALLLRASLLQYVNFVKCKTESIWTGMKSKVDAIKFIFMNPLYSSSGVIWRAD